MARKGMVLQEYLVSLGAEVDQRGIMRIQNALRSTSIAFGALSTVVTSAVIVFAKVSKSLVDTAENYEYLAKKQNKAVDAVAAHEMALKTMGKTIEEVRKNDKLKKTYDDLVAIGKEIGMPSAAEGREGLSKFMTELNRFKLTSRYAMQYINNEFLNKITGPLDKLRKTLEEMRKKLIENMPKISSVVGNGLGIIVRLFESGVRGIRDFIDVINNLPTSVKIAGGSMAGLWAIMKASPIMWVLAGLTSLLLLLDDYYAYKRDDPNAYGEIWQALELGTLGELMGGQLENAMEKVKEKIDGFLDIGEKIADKVLEGLLGYDFEGQGEKLGGIVNKLFDAITKLLTPKEGATLMPKIEKALGALVRGIGEATVTFLDTVKWEDIGSKGIGGFINGLFGWIAGLLKPAEGEKSLITVAVEVVDSIANSIGKLVVGALDGIKWKEIVSGGIDIASRLLTGLFDALFGTEEVRGDNDEIVQEATTGIIDAGVKALDNIAEAVGNAVVDALDGIEWQTIIPDSINMVSRLLTGLVDTLFGSAEARNDNGEIVREGKTGIIKAGVDVLNNIAEAVGSVVVDAVDGIEWAQIIPDGLDVAGRLLTGLIETLFGKGEVLDDSGAVVEEATTGLLGTATGIAEKLIESLTRSVSTIPWDTIGDKVGGFVNELFSGIGNYISEEANKEGGGVIGGLVDAGKAIVTGLMDAIGSFFENVSPSDLATSVMNIVNGLFDMLTKAFQSEGEEESQSIGYRIGQTIADSIQFTGEFIFKLADEIMKSLDNGALNRFLEVGVRIGEQIFWGLYHGLGDWAVELLFGEEEKKRVQEARRKKDAIRSNKTIGYDVETGELFTSVEMEGFAGGNALGLGTDWRKLKAVEPGAHDEETQKYLDAIRNAWYHQGVEWEQNQWGEAQLKEWKPKRVWKEGSKPGDLEMQVHAALREAVANKDVWSIGVLSDAIGNAQEAMRMAWKSEKGSDVQKNYFQLAGDAFAAAMRLYGSGEKGEKIPDNWVDELDLDVALPQASEVARDVNKITAQAQKDVKPIEVPIKYRSPGGGGGEEVKEAAGGRHTSPTRALLSEFGQTEYVIPTDRPERAKGLILQMFADMGSRAKSIREALGIRDYNPQFAYANAMVSGSHSYAGGSSTVKSNSDNVVDAPTTINVYGGGDAQATGRAAYDAHKNSLMRHIRGVFG